MPPRNLIIGRLRWSRVSDLPQPVAALGLLAVLFIYVTSFWGRAGLLLPAPLDNWHYIFYRGLTRWSEGAQQLLRAGENLALYSGVEAFVMGLIAPAALLTLCWRRSPTDLGLRWPDALGWRWTVVGTALSIPVGLWVTALVPPRGSHLTYVINILAMIPEHFLIFGVGVALLLPGRRLPNPPLPVANRGVGKYRIRNWLGVTAPEPRDVHAALLERMGLSPASLFAILGAAVLFVVVHVGARPVELAFSAPMGVFCAYVTWRTTSIWPALLIHWSLNLVPLGLRSLFG